MGNKKIRLLKHVAGVMLLGLITTFSACEDKVDTSDMYVFEGQQIIDFLNSTEQTSYFAELTKRVRLSKKSESTIAELLSARGNYTCFAPTNEAIQQFLDSMYATKNYNVADTPDSTAAYIVNNALIDHGDMEPYLSTLFNIGTLGLPNFASRYLTVRFDTVAAGRLAIMINTYSRIIQVDNELANGVVHLVNRVITPSNSSVPTMIGNTDNLQIFARLLEVTGWDQQMTEWRDEYYEENHPYDGPNCPTESPARVLCPEHRDKGYTALVETDSLLVEKWNLPELQFSESGGIVNWDQILEIIKEKCKEYYPNATSDDPKSEDNALNQFVSYHLIPIGLSYDRLVNHFNEFGYAYKITSQLGIDVWEYYVTMGKHKRLLKIMEGKKTNGLRINRYVSERNLANYEEISCPRPGILICESNGGREYNALNGYYYVIDDVLVYDDDVPNKVLNERLRFDVCALLPEMMTNNFRMFKGSDWTVNYKNIPPGYFENMWFTEESNVAYLNGYDKGYGGDFQGDEYNIQGAYDVTVKLPPVPFAGTWQFRYGTQNVKDRRSMCQFYFGSNRNHLNACGLPLDMRIYGGEVDYLHWFADGRDADENDENDHAMFRSGYMKAPLYFCAPVGSTASGARENYRNNQRVYRCIVYTGYMEPGKDYYLRMKSCLDNTEKQLFIDYFELVPKMVYANDANPEDKW